MSIKVTLDTKAKSSVEKIGLNPDDVALVLARLTSIAPHISFSDWTLFEGQEPLRKNQSWAHVTEDGAHCHLFLTKNIHIFAELSAFERIRKLDLQLLNHMAKEAAKLLESSIETIISLSNFGMHAISRTLASMVNLPPEQVGSYLKFLRSISGETYENQRLAYGLILSGAQPPKTSAILEFENKRFKRLTDGFSTALTLNRHGGIIELTSLTAPREQKNPNLGRPLWLAGLADTAHLKGGPGIALTKTGDILITHNRELLFSQRAGEWRIWRHKAILEIIATIWDPPGNKTTLPDVLASLYKVALDLSFRRTGGLLVIIERRDKLSTLVNAPSDVLGAPSRTNAERALDKSLSGANVLGTDRRIIADLSSLDGALVVDRHGSLLAYGAMVSSKKKTETQGSRTRAAEGASKLGLAIKVSSDGGISVYLNGRARLAL